MQRKLTIKWQNIIASRVHQPASGRRMDLILSKE
jgi:hypothetical protein